MPTSPLDLLYAHPEPALRVRDGHVVWMNEAAATVFGPHLTRLLTTDDRTELLVWASRPGPARRTSLLRGAHTRIAMTRSTPADLDGDTLLLCTIFDASEIAKENRRFRQAIATRQIAIYEHDHVTDVIFGSEQLREMWRFGDAELTTHSFVERVHPEDQERLARDILKAHDPDGDGLFDTTHRLVDEDGGTRWIHMKGRSYFFEDEDGARRVRRTVGSMSDITALVVRQQQVERLAATLEATPDVVAMARPDGSLLHLNAAARALLPANVASPFLGDFIAEGDRDRFTAVVRSGLSTNPLWTGELELRHPDLDVIPAHVTLQLHPSTDRVEGFVSFVARDLTAIRELERRLLHSQKLEAVGRLAGGIAHDFNNMLSVIEGFAFLAREAAHDNPQILECLDPIQHAARSAADLTGELLSFSRKQVMRPQLVSIADVVVGMRTMIERLVGDAIDVQLDLQGRETRILVDPGRLEHVVMNLIVNARDAMPEGGVLLLETRTTTLDAGYAERQEEVAPGHYALLAVSDTGSGMDEETRSRVFEPYFTTKQVGKGSGLGLATVFGTVKQCGGHVTVYSEPGRGSTFKVYLPVAGGDEVVAEPDPEPFEGPLAGLRVLVVDDEASLRRMVVKVLRRRGLVPIEANGPLDALAIARDETVDIDMLLTDVVMPHMSGKDLAIALEDLGRRVPVLYMSGYTENTVVHHGVVDPGTRFLSKPFTPDQLTRAIGIALAGARDPGDRTP